jgi:hypothetical protein
MLVTRSGKCPDDLSNEQINKEKCKLFLKVQLKTKYGMKQRTVKNVYNCLNPNIHSYLKTSGN